MRRFSCSTIAFRQHDLATALREIEDLGFSHADIGILPDFCEHFDPFGASTADEDAFAATVRRSSLRVHTFTSFVGAWNEADADWDGMRRVAIRLLSLAKRVGAYGVNVNCGFYRDRELHPLDEDIRIAGPRIGWMAEEAAARGLKLMIEAPHKNLLIRRADEAAALVEACAHPNVSLIFDCNHHHVSGWPMADSVRALRGLIGLVHLRDAVGRDNVYPIGAGDIDFAGLVEALRETEYEGLYAFEFTDAADTIEGVRDMLRASFETMGEVLDRAGVR